MHDLPHHPVAYRRLRDLLLGLEVQAVEVPHLPVHWASLARGLQDSPPDKVHQAQQVQDHTQAKQDAQVQVLQDSLPVKDPHPQDKPGELLFLVHMDNHRLNRIPRNHNHLQPRRPHRKDILDWGW
jgi:hypothetical protein